MKLWTRHKKLKNENGCFNPSRLKNLNPLEPKREYELRQLYYDCKNVRDLLNELDRVNKMLQEQDHEIWEMIHGR